MNKKTIIIFCFLAVAIGLVAFLGPRMVSASAIAMSNVDMVTLDYPSAMEHLKLAIEMDAHSAAAYQQRGSLYSRLGKPEKAIRDYSRALEYGGGSECVYNRGSQYHTLGHLDLAIKDYQAYLDKHPAKKMLVCVNLSDAYYRLDKIPASLAECNKAIAEAPKDSTALLNRAQCFLYQHRYKAAIDDLSTGLDNIYRRDNDTDTVPESLVKRDSYLMRGNTYLALKQEEEAAVDYGEARRAAHVHHKSTSEAKLFEADFSEKAVRHHFILCSNLSAKDNDIFADRLEMFLKFVDKNICFIKLDRNFRIFYFPNATAYREYLVKKKLPQSTDPSETTDTGLSNYNVDHDAVFTCSEADLVGTVGSVMKKVLADQPFADRWSTQQFASLLARAFGYSTVNECHLYLPQDARCYSVPASPRPLVELINTSISPRDEEDSCLVSLFLFRTGKWRTYFDLCQSGKVSDYATIFEAAFNKRTAAIEPEWQAFLKDLKTELATPGNPPKNEIFATKQAFDKLTKDNPQLKLISLAAPSNPDLGAHGKSASKAQSKVR